MELLGQALLEPVCERLINTAFEEYALVRGVKGEIEKLRSTVDTIKAVIRDAEGKQVGSELVRTWLSSLKQILFDAQDILDEVATNAALRRRDRRLVWTNHVGAKVRNIICCFGTVHNLLADHGIAHQIKHIRELLDAKSKDISTLGLERLGVGTMSDFIRPTRPQTSSLPTDDPDIIGRDDEKKNLEELLLVGCEDGTEGSSSSRSNNVRVISITGMGGVGKTTLVQLVYNSPRVKQHFHPTIWVCVSNDFDLERISGEILDAIAGSDKVEGPRNVANWDKTQLSIREKIEGKRFLLVLDDMWEEYDHDKWESLCKPLRYGGKGSKIVVTARNPKVSHIVKGTHIPLAILSSGSLRSMFERFAFKGCDPNKRTQLEPVGRQIADKLKGLPLAAKIVGQLLNARLDVRYWQSILRSERWAKSSGPNDILPILKLSYDQLSGHLKQCFAYCSLFPKHYRFSRDELVQLWTAQNFIHVLKGSHVDQSDMDENFDDLLHASFFEQSREEEFVMHDLIHDLAESVSQDDNFKLVQNDRNERIPETVRHVSLVTNSFDPTRLDKLCKLRTLLFLRVDLNVHLDVMFMKFKRLRVLILWWCKINKLPKSIGTLKHLRYVDLSGTDITMLPESICNLHNLQVLKLQHCRWLRALPGNMSALVNLMHLKLENGNEELVDSIQDLGKLTALQELNIRGVKGKELGDMSMLRHLHIRNLEQVAGKEEAVQARLDDKKYLETLRLGWRYDAWVYHPSSHDHGTSKEEEEEGVLEGLQPVDSIRELDIRYYGGVRSPRWLEDASWVSSSFLERVKLRDCKNWEVLPPLGQLRGLKELEIRGMSRVRRIDPGQGGGGFQMLGFPSLESLKFTDMPEWEEWEAPHHHGDDDHEEEGQRQQQQVLFLSRLHTLEIRDCPKLKELPPLPRSLQSLDIWNVGLTRLPRLVGCCGGGGDAGRDADHMSLSELSVLSIIECPNLRSLDDDDDGLLQHPLPRLSRLSIRDCRELTSLPYRAFAHFTSLTQLDITDCPKLSTSSLPSVSTADEANMPCSLEEVYIDGGDMVEHFLLASIMPKLTCLSVLDVSVGSSSTAQLLLNGILQNQSVAATLETLAISRDHRHDQQHQACSSSSNIPSLIVPPASPLPLQMEKVAVGQTNNIRDHLTSLTCLEIGDCSDLLQLSGLPSSLERLYIWKDTHLDDRILATYLQGLCRLTFLCIDGCPHITSLPTAEVLCHLTALESLNIQHCRELMSWGGGVHNLIALQELSIFECPKLQWLPSVGLPKSLSKVSINGSSIPTGH